MGKDDEGAPREETKPRIFPQKTKSVYNERNNKEDKQKRDKRER